MRKDDTDRRRELNRQFREANPDYHREYFSRNAEQQLVIQIRWRYRERVQHWSDSDWALIRTLAEFKYAYQRSSGRKLRLQTINRTDPLTPYCFGVVEVGTGCVLKMLCE